MTRPARPRFQTYGFASIGENTDQWRRKVARSDTFSTSRLPLSSLLFGPMLAVCLWRHAASPAELTIEIGKVAIAAVICDLRDVFVGISQKLARIADTKFYQDFDEGASGLIGVLPEWLQVRVTEPQSAVG